MARAPKKQEAQKPYRIENGWLIDAGNNRASITHWGEEEKAAASLASLTDCRNCVNCSDCSGCSGCSRCSDCSYCSRCSDCSGCSYCSNCSGCSGCSRCSGCSGCSYCSGCSGCSGCSYCSKGAETVVIPKIENIHQQIYAAASQPDALDMGGWHCGTTHCRAGWTVHLAGEAGYALERRFNTELAAMMIYRESGALINPCRFYDENQAALDDMRKLAEEVA